MKQNSIIFWTGILGVFLFVGSTVIGGYLLPGYSHISQFISESYALGTPHGESLRKFGFIPSGIFITVFSFVYPKVLPRTKMLTYSFYGLGIFYGFGTIFTSIFPCDLGCEMNEPSLAQLLHNLMGFLTYLIVPLCLILIGIKLKNLKNYALFALISLVMGGIALLFVWILFAEPNANFKGLYQRIVEGSILFWILYAAKHVLKSTRSFGSL
ncbi:MAG: DUF998 domain-containing protein [Allomuricauda sp.]|nr:MAG: DUF998 domain-containing protein [Allomuricauda sp.]